MRTISNLFARSPFTPLQSHMSHVEDCSVKVREIFDAFFASDFEAVNRIAEEISELEHQADITKNDIRSHLPKGLFLPVDRGNLMEILAIQDGIADRCEDIGVLLTLRSFSFPPTMIDDFNNFLNKNIESIGMVHKVIQKLDELLETGFSGTEAANVRKMISEVAFMEHEADVLQRQLLKITFEHESEICYGTFFLIVQSFKAISSLSNYAEKLANRVGLMLDLK
jgi:predicted phosphate transport protein (TIGR00153 family)